MNNIQQIVNNIHIGAGRPSIVLCRIKNEKQEETRDSRHHFANNGLFTPLFSLRTGLVALHSRKNRSEQPIMGESAL